MEGRLLQPSEARVAAADAGEAAEEVESAAVVHAGEGGRRAAPAGSASASANASASASARASASGAAVRQPASVADARCGGGASVGASKGASET